MVSTSSVTDNPASALFLALNGDATTSTNKMEDAQSRFLTLLTAQLKNQDPLNPMENAEMTSQMAQISTVDGIERLNATLHSLLADSANSQALQASALIGKGVLVPGRDLVLEAGQAFAGVDLAGAADAVKVEIFDSNGLLMRTLNLGDVDAGPHTFVWDGNTNDGVAAMAGNYTFKVTAVQGGENVDTTPLALGLVSSVTRGSNGLSLNIGQQSFAMADVRQIL